MQDGRIQSGDRIIAVGEEPVSGMSVEKVQIPTHSTHFKDITQGSCDDSWPTCCFSVQVSKLILDQQVNVKLSVSRSQSLLFFTPSLPKSLSCPCSQSPTSSLTHPVSSSSSFFTATQTSPTGHNDWLGSSPLTSDPKSCPVVAGRETTIEIVKGSVGLGLSIIGGCDTLLVFFNNWSLTFALKGLGFINQKANVLGWLTR